MWGNPTLFHQPKSCEKKLKNDEYWKNIEKHHVKR